MTTQSAPRRRRARRGEGHVLREEILQASRELLAEVGSFDALSVRSVADRVGVSTPAIYLHFEDKDALVFAVCELVFADLDAYMAAAEQESEDPLELLRSLAIAYARFAMEHPEEYRVVMMSPPGHQVGTAYVLDTVSHRRLVAAIVRCQEAGLFAPDASPLVMSLVLWCTVHGVVSLYLVRPFFQEWVDAVEIAVIAGLNAALGIMAAERLGEHAQLLLRGDGDAAALAARLDAALGAPVRVLRDVAPPPLPTGDAEVRPGAP